MGFDPKRKPMPIYAQVVKWQTRQFEGLLSLQVDVPVQVRLCAPFNIAPPLINRGRTWTRVRVFLKCGSYRRMTRERFAELAQLVSALVLQTGGYGFKSLTLHQWRTSQMAKAQACKALSSRFKSGVRLHMGKQLRGQSAGPKSLASGFRYSPCPPLRENV